MRAVRVKYFPPPPRNIGANKNTNHITVIQIFFHIKCSMVQGEFGRFFILGPFLDFDRM